MPTLVILNPHAAGGRAGKTFAKIKDRLSRLIGKLTVAITKTPEEISQHLDAISTADTDRIIAVGGDGTNNAVISALSERPHLNLTFGSVPIGTGHDWARTLGVPSDPIMAVDWLGYAKPVPCDLGRIEYCEKGQNRIITRTFLNISSAGVSGEVDARVNRARRRTHFTFLYATIASLLRYKPKRTMVKCDGAMFYEGDAYLIAIANGRYFGKGMLVAPNAIINDGLFDVVLVEKMPRRRILFALHEVFSGRHLQRGDVHHTRAATVNIHCDEGPLALECDGEEACGHDLTYTVLPAAVRILIDPTVAAVSKTGTSGISDS